MRESGGDSERDCPFHFYVSWSSNTGSTVFTVCVFKGASAYTGHTLAMKLMMMKSPAPIVATHALTQLT